MKLFDPTTASLSKSCQRLIEDAQSVSGTAKYLDHLERTWQLYEPFAPPSFKQQLLGDESKFYSLTWEMILGATLLEHSYDLEPSTDDRRPDLCINTQGRRIWVECSLPTGGDPSKPNSVQEKPCDGSVHDIDHDKSVLRCAQALVAKKKQHLKWLADGVCSQHEAFIIAINGLNLHLDIHHTFLPDVLRALYGTGDIYVVFDSKDPSYKESGYNFKPAIAKSKIAAIPTTFFLEENNNHISGVIYSTFWFMRYSTSPQYSYVENVNAKNKTGSILDEFCQTYEYQSNQISLKKA